MAMAKPDFSKRHWMALEKRVSVHLFSRHPLYTIYIYIYILYVIIRYIRISRTCGKLARQSEQSTMLQIYNISTK